MRHSLLLLTILFFCSGLFAQPGTGIRIDDFTSLTPRLNLSANFDDNINIRQRALDETDEPIPADESDIFFEYLLSLGLNRRVGTRALTATAYIGEELYQDYSELDAEKYGASLGYLWASSSQDTTVDFTGSYRYAIDSDGTSSVPGFARSSDDLEGFQNVSDRVERDILASSITLTQAIGADLGTALSFGMNDIDYANDEFNDRTSYDYEAELNYQATPKTQTFGRVGLGIDDDEGFAEDSENPFVLVGARYRPTVKSMINASVGYESYEITPLETTFSSEVVSETSPGEKQDDDGFKYRLSATYSLNAKTTLSVTARNGYASQGTENSRPKRETSAALSLRHKTTDQFSQTIGMNYREDDYLNPITIDEVEYDETRETLRYFYRFTYNTPRPWLSFFGSVSFEDGTSNIPDGRNEYDQTEGKIGARLSY